MGMRPRQSPPGFSLLRSGRRTSTQLSESTDSDSGGEETVLTPVPTSGTSLGPSRPSALADLEEKDFLWNALRSKSFISDSGEELRLRPDCGARTS